ncbi:uncharacterized protein LOC113681918 [Pocillopora damicornis]|uniref:uncharacterized protein LOC113681918 n=1 Tax=Pocillopora damicornis TaxID=46731 RepID=UPI000F555660|nr:uncharacterized protein LOC113681918 [Pocillopora damicornis]
MTSPTLFLYAGVFFFLIYSYVCDLPVEDTTKQCEYDNIKRCNDEFKQVFMNATAGKRETGVRNVYCTALQVFMNCLDGSLGRCIGGSWLQNYSYVVLEHGIMDKKCGVCPHHNYHDLERVLNARNRTDYIGFDICPLCAKVVHNTCVEQFLENRTNANMCHNVQKFINCYEKVGDGYCARWKIVRSFSNLCRQLGEKMLQEDEKHRGLMC